ncbi:MAG TPA: flagellar hook-length control protein FliK, partial [Sphingobium sp.]
LKLDASLSAVRIAEVKIERAAPVAEAARSDMSGQQSPQQQSQHSSSQNHSAWQNGGQDMSQPQGQQGRWQPRQNNGFDPKSAGDPAVLNHGQAQDRASETARARYA